MRAVIVDIDGTLCDVSGIRVHVTKTATHNYRDYTSFHAAAIDCPPISTTVELVRDYMYAGRRIILVTARGEQWRQQTVWWLRMRNISYHQLWMRAEGDTRSDVLVKRDIYLQIMEVGDVIVTHAIDDNPFIVAPWQQLGIPVTVVPGWVDDGRAVDAQTTQLVAFRTLEESLGRRVR